MRTITDIQNEIIIAKENSTTLADLNSTSQTAIWKAITYMVAVAIYSFEKILDLFKTDLEAYAATIATGTLKWYQERCLDFRYNYDIVWNGTRYEYETLSDNDLQAALVITQAAVVERADATLLIKVVKGEVGNLEPLDANEQASFTAYINKIKFAGTKVLVTSYDADEVQLTYTIYYNAIYNLDETKQAVKDAMVNYAQQLPFNSILNITKLTDEIQKIKGVTDVIYKEGEANTPIQSIIIREYEAQAGYLNLTNLNNTLTFIAS